MHDLKVFFWIAASVVDAAALNHNGIKILFLVLSTFFIKRNPVFTYCPTSLPKNPLDCPPISDSWDFDDFILAYELFTKVLRSLETFALVKNNLCGKLVSPLELLITFNLKLLQYPFLFLISIY